jgi:hypothetical protein
MCFFIAGAPIEKLETRNLGDFRLALSMQGWCQSQGQHICLITLETLTDFPDSGGKELTLHVNK